MRECPSFRKWIWFNHISRCSKFTFAEEYLCMHATKIWIKFISILYYIVSIVVFYTRTSSANVYIYITLATYNNFIFWEFKVSCIMHFIIYVVAYNWNWSIWMKTFQAYLCVCNWSNNGRSFNDFQVMCVWHNIAFLHFVLCPNMQV